MTGPHYRASIVVDRTPEQVYDLVTDITRTGEWSPICRECWWVDGDGPRVGAWFGGRNEADGRTWETTSQVTAAVRAREFAWRVSGRYAQWAYTLDDVAGGTELTESWEFGEDTLSFFREKYGAEADARIALRVEQASTGIPATLSAIKRIAESTPAG